MRKFPDHRGLPRLASCSALVLLLGGLLSCLGAAQPGVSAGYRYFETPDPNAIRLISASTRPASHRRLIVFGLIAWAKSGWHQATG